MKFKNFITLAAAAAVSVSALSPSVLAAEEEEAKTLTYGTDYTCAAYFNNAVLTTGDDAAKLNVEGTLFNRENGGTGKEGYYAAYAVFDISRIDMESVTVDTNLNGEYKLFYTDNEDIAAKAPKDVAGDNSDYNYDLCGDKNNYYAKFKACYNLKSLDTNNISAAKDSNYLVIAFTGWKETTLNSVTITGTSTVSDTDTGNLPIYSVYGLYKDDGTQYTAEDARALVDGDKNTGLTINRQKGGVPYLNYVIFGNGTDNLIFNKIGLNGQGKAIVYGTDDISFFSKLDTTNDISYNGNKFNNAVKDAGGSVEELYYPNSDESGDFEKELSETKRYKYVFVLFNGWKTSNINEITLANEEVPAETNIKTVNAGVSNGTDGSVATSFVTVVSGDGTTFNTIQWNVKSGSEEKVSDEISISDITLGNGSKAVFGLIVDGLNDAGASAEAAVK